MAKKTTKKAASSAAATTGVGDTLQIPGINWKEIRLFILGITSLMFNRFPHETLVGIQETLEKGPEEQKKPRAKALPPAMQAFRALYLDDKERVCVPSWHIKAAMGNAVSMLPGNGMGKILSKAKFRGAVHVLGFKIPLASTPYTINSQMVKSGGKSGGRVPAHRPEFALWALPVTIKFDADLFTPEAVVALLARAGSQCGIGSYRINCNGPHGEFRPGAEREYREG